LHTDPFSDATIAQLHAELLAYKDANGIAKDKSPRKEKSPTKGKGKESLVSTVVLATGESRVAEGGSVLIYYFSEENQPASIHCGKTNMQLWSFLDDAALCQATDYPHHPYEIYDTYRKAFVEIPTHSKQVVE
jgi:hypothetical protein